MGSTTHSYPSDWPKATDWASKRALTRRGRDRKAKNLKALEASAKRESQRQREPVTSEPPKGLFKKLTAAENGQRCRICKQYGGLREVESWRAGYTTRRCAYCLGWRQVAYHPQWLDALPPWW